MSRGANTFKQGDVTKALKGAEKAGLKVQRAEVRALFFLRGHGDIGPFVPVPLPVSGCGGIERNCLGGPEVKHD